VYRTRPVEDPVRRWRRFCRAGWGMAAVAATAWMGGLMVVFRLAPEVDSLPPKPSPRISWWAGSDLHAAEQAGAADIRAVWSPSVFALPTPAGFSHSLRSGRIRLAPPVHLSPTDKTFLPPPGGESAFEAGPSGRIRLNPPRAPATPATMSGVFPPRDLSPEAPGMLFPAGWESRLFSGIDLSFGAWTNRAWTARIEMRFDVAGVPVSMLLTESSGWPEVDRRLVRQARGWRLLESGAPRAGVVTWRVPGSSSTVPAGGRAP
jgi:hypothetical protein